MRSSGGSAIGGSVEARALVEAHPVVDVHHLARPEINQNVVQVPVSESNDVPGSLVGTQVFKTLRVKVEFKSLTLFLYLKVGQLTHPMTLMTARERAYTACLAHQSALPEDASQSSRSSSPRSPPPQSFL